MYNIIVLYYITPASHSFIHPRGRRCIAAPPETRLIHWLALAPLSYKVNKFCHSSWFGSMLCIWLAVWAVHSRAMHKSIRETRAKIRLSVVSQRMFCWCHWIAGRQSIPLLLISVIWRSVCIARIQPRILFIFVVAIIASRIAIVVTANEYPDGFAINCCARSNLVGGFPNQKWRTPFQSQIRQSQWLLKSPAIILLHLFQE